MNAYKIAADLLNAKNQNLKILELEMEYVGIHEQVAFTLRNIETGEKFTAYGYIDGDLAHAPTQEDMDAVSEFLRDLTQEQFDAQCSLVKPARA